MNINERIDEVWIGGCDNRNRGLIDEEHEGRRKPTKKDGVLDPLNGNAPWVRVKGNAGVSFLCNSFPSS